jgi:predicted transcriptional regulator
MPKDPMVGARIPQDYINELDAICEATGRSRSQIILEAIEVYLGKESGNTVESELAALRQEVEAFKKKYTSWETFSSQLTARMNGLEAFVRNSQIKSLSEDEQTQLIAALQRLIGEARDKLINQEIEDESRQQLQQQIEAWEMLLEKLGTINTQ